MRGLIAILKPMGPWGAASLVLLALCSFPAAAYLSALASSPPPPAALEIGPDRIGPWTVRIAMTTPGKEDDAKALVWLRCSGCIAMVESVELIIQSGGGQTAVPLAPRGAAWIARLPARTGRDRTVSLRAESHDGTVMMKRWSFGPLDAVF